MGDYTKTLAKPAADLLESGEQLLAATIVTPKGGLNQRFKRALVAGAIGAATAPAPASEIDVPLAATMTIGVTDRRLLLFEQNKLTGRPKQFLGAVPVAQVESVTAEDGRAAMMKMLSVRLVFVDGTQLELEVPRVNLGDGHRVVDELRKLLPTSR